MKNKKHPANWMIGQMNHPKLRTFISWAKTLRFPTFPRNVPHSSARLLLTAFFTLSHYLASYHLLRTEEEDSTETSVNLQVNIRQHIHGSRNLHSHRCENFTFCIES
jgi:hypothetical protein